MNADSNGRKSYQIDDRGFLVRPEEWDEEFAVSTAPSIGVTTGLTDDHWRVIKFIRSTFEKFGQVPLVYVTCINNSLRLRDLKRLFPAGYHRGACRLAGVSYRTGYYNFWVEREPAAGKRGAPDKVYRIDALGFLVDPAEWDESFAVHKAVELKMPAGITDEHWKIIRYLRDAFAEDGAIPTVFKTCEDNGIEIEDLQRLFPDGYHRGAVKLAGLRLS